MHVVDNFKTVTWSWNPFLHFTCVACWGKVMFLNKKCPPPVFK